MVVGLLLFVAGCGMSQQEKMARDRLEQAHAAYDRAKSDPNVTGAAQVPLIDAEKNLQAADNASDYKNKEHLAYLAQKKAETAEVLGQGRAADLELEQLQKQSNEAVILKKEQETKAARGEAAEKGRQLERAQVEAGQTKAEMERQKAEAETIKAEAIKSKADNEQLMQQLSELKAKQTDRGVVLTIGGVLFEFGKADLLPQANASIDKLAQFLADHPDRNLSIEGHTDSVGTDRYNDDLSERRAEAVKSALVAKGIDPARIVTKGLGKRFPVASNDTAQGRQLNRRVEVVVLNQVATRQPPQANPSVQPTQPRGLR